MKHPIKSKKHADKKPATPASAPPIVGRGKILRMLGLALCLIVAAVGTWAVFEFVVWNVQDPRLIGKWFVTSGPQEGATFDFYRNGSMIGNVNVRGSNAIVEAVVRVEGQKLYSTTINPNTNRPDTRVQRIVVLTGNTFVLEDEQGQRLEMERAY